MWRCLRDSIRIQRKCWREDSRKGKWAQIGKGWKALAFVLWVIMADPLIIFEQ